MPAGYKTEAVRIPDGSARLDGDLHVPDRAIGLVIFAHGSGSSRFSPRNRQVAEALESAGCATLRLECTVEELVKTIHAHPTFSEAIGEAAHAAHGAAIHL